MRLTSKRARMQGNVGERKLGTERELHRLVIKSVANTQPTQIFVVTSR